MADNAITDQVPDITGGNVNSIVSTHSSILGHEYNNFDGVSQNGVDHDNKPSVKIRRITNPTASYRVSRSAAGLTTSVAGIVALFINVTSLPLRAAATWNITTVSSFQAAPTSLAANGMILVATPQDVSTQYMCRSAMDLMYAGCNAQRFPADQGHRRSSLSSPSWKRGESDHESSEEDATG
jgi:hypothetical protein